MSKTRAGRKSWETRVNFSNEVKNFASSMATAKWKYDSATTKAMIIRRTSIETGKTEVVTFSQAYAELNVWFDKAYSNISEFGLSDMLAETFFQHASIHTPKAVYKLWVKPEPKPEMLCLNDRKDEFRSSLRRAENSNLEVFPNFERDEFVVVNKDTKGEYKVKLLSSGGLVLSSCECPDYKNRSRVCKHISEVLADTFFGALYKDYPGRIALTDRPHEGETVIAYCGCVCNREKKTTEIYCARHEWDLEYWQAIAADIEQTAQRRFLSLTSKGGFLRR